MPAVMHETRGMLTTDIQPALDYAHQPSSKHASLQLDIANDAEREHTWRFNFEEWGGVLSEQGYYERERYLMNASLTNKNKMVVWILVSPDLPKAFDGTRYILSSCETVLKNAWVARDGQIQRIATHGVSSVFCRREYRGQGYASRMISELQRKLEILQQPKGTRGTFSVLYSDIGRRFYARYNWLPFPSKHMVLEPLRARNQARNPDVQNLEAADLLEVPTTRYLEEALVKTSKEKPGVPHVAIRPDLPHFKWHHMREEFICRATNRGFPNVKGALHKPTGIAILWNRILAAEASKCILSILLVIVPPTLTAGPQAVDALASLFARAQHEAFLWDMRGGVEIWNPSSLAIQAAQKLKGGRGGEIEVVTRRSEHICSLRWNGPEKNVVWVNNEWYAWC